MNNKELSETYNISLRKIRTIKKEYSINKRIKDTINISLILSEFIWKLPATEIAKVLDISDSMIGKHCKSLDIKKPSRGYWSRKKSYNLPISKEDLINDLENKLELKKISLKYNYNIEIIKFYLNYYNIKKES